MRSFTMRLFLHATISQAIPQSYCVSFYMIKINRSSMIFSIMFLSSCGPSMVAMHGSHQIAFTSRCKCNQEKIFQRVNNLFKSKKERFFPEIVLTF